MRRILSLWIAVSSLAAAQDAAPDTSKLRDAVEWTSAQRGRMLQMTNRVTQVHGIASLAMLVCPENPGEGSNLFRQAITSLHGIPSNHFTEKRTMPLPVASQTSAP